MTRQQLEQNQVWLYLAAILAGLALGVTSPEVAVSFDAALWFVLALMLYATFTQVPLAGLPAAFRDARFMAAMLIGNFVLVPKLLAPRSDSD